MCTGPCNRLEYETRTSSRTKVLVTLSFSLWGCVLFACLPNSLLQIVFFRPSICLCTDHHSYLKMFVSAFKFTWPFISNHWGKKIFLLHQFQVPERERESDSFLLSLICTASSISCDMGFRLKWYLGLALMKIGSEGTLYRNTVAGRKWLAGDVL